MIDKDVEEVEELVPLEELEYVESDEVLYEPAVSESSSLKLIKTNIFHKLKVLYDRSSIPILITDSQFIIVYGNSEFHEKIIRQRNFLDKSFFNIIDSMEDRKYASKIIDNLRSPETGNSWIGKISISHKRFLNVAANAIFTPIYEGESELEIPPIGYICMFDDITKDNREILSRTYLSLLEASKLKDNDTGNHIRRVGEYSRIISKQLFLNQSHPEVNVQFIENIAFLAPMHDVGKIGTPDDILNKNGPLDEKEWQIMKEHTINGGFIMGGYPDSMAKQIPLSHHEKWDGSGYPFQLSEEMIPLSARITAIADVYDALRMKRSYKNPFTHKQTIEMMFEDSGKHFDPELMDIFHKVELKVKDVFELLHD